MTESRPVLVKLGGSLLTDKSGNAALRRDRLARLAGEIAAFRDRRPEAPPLILGHGSGSFGHRAAAEHGIGARPLEGPDDRQGAARTAAEAARLHRAVLVALLDAGVPAVSFAPSSAFIARRGTPVGGTLRPLVNALEGGWVPVLYGDVMMDEEWGAAVCSTEAVFLFVARRLVRRGAVPSRAIWLGVTDGILDPDGRTVPEVGPDRVDAVRRFVGGSAGTDVTGGMVLRYRTVVALAALGVESLVADGRQAGLLEAALDGRRAGGTIVHARAT